MRNFLLNLLKAVNTWSDVTDWHSWVIHGVLAIPITMLFGAPATVAFYLLRELEQLAHEYISGVSPKYKDHVYDWVIPALVSGVTAWLL